MSTLLLTPFPGPTYPNTVRRINNITRTLLPSNCIYAMAHLNAEIQQLKPVMSDGGRTNHTVHLSLVNVRLLKAANNFTSRFEYGTHYTNR